MHYGKIIYEDVANGPGLRTSIFVSGCTRHCKGCFNEETWDFHYGKEFTIATWDEIARSLEPEHISGLSILGGEPMESENRVVVLGLASTARRMGKTTWVYTGYTWEELMERRLEDSILASILTQVDVLVDGPFIQEQKDLRLRFRGSRNQRIIDVPKSLLAGEVVPWTEE